MLDFTSHSGRSTILAVSLGLVPFKDSFWTTSFQPNSSVGNNTDPNPVIQVKKTNLKNRQSVHCNAFLLLLLVDSIYNSCFLFVRIEKLGRASKRRVLSLLEQYH